MKCAVVGCKNCSGSQVKDIDGITFHVFPVSKDIRKEWIRIMNKPNNWTPTKYSKICSVHFDENDFYRTKKGFKKLHHGAVPKLPMSNEESDANASDEQESQANVLEGTSDAMPNTSRVQESGVHQAQNIEKDLEPFLKLNDTPRSNILKWEIKRLKIENIKKNKKIKQLQARNRRLKKKMASVESLLNDLQKKK